MGKIKELTYYAVVIKGSLNWIGLLLENDSLKDKFQ